MQLTVILKADGSGLTGTLRVASSEIEKLGGTATRAAGQANTLSSGVGRLRDNFDSLRSVVAALGIAVVTRQLIATADAMTGMNARLRIATGSLEAFAVAQQSVRDIAEDSRASLDSVATLYTRLAQSAASLNIEQSALAEITEAVSTAVSLSGGSAASASAGVTQLAQAFASGVLSGDEFRSVMENSPRVVKALTDSLGVGVGELRRLSEAQKLSADVIAEALRLQLATLRAEMAQTPQTVSQALGQISNAWSLYVDAVNTATGETSALAQVLGVVAQLIAEQEQAARNGEGGLEVMANGLRIVILAATAAKNVIEALVNVLAASLDAAMAFGEGVSAVLGASIRAYGNYFAALRNLDFAGAYEAIAQGNQQIRDSATAAWARMQNAARTGADGVVGAVDDVLVMYNRLTAELAAVNTASAQGGAADAELEQRKAALQERIQELLGGLGSLNKANRNATRDVGVLSGAYDDCAVALELLNTEFETNAKAAKAYRQALDAPTEAARELESILSSFDNIGFGKLVSDMDRVKAALETATDPKQVARLQKAMGELRQEAVSYATGALGEGITALKSMASEGSKAYAALETAQTALNLATAIGAIANQGLGDPYTAFARIAAMAAMMSQLVDGLGSIRGGLGDSAARRQASQGTGTVLGDRDAKSESISRAIQITAAATSELVGINRGMLTALQAMQAGLSGASTLLARGAGGVTFDNLRPAQLSTINQIGVQLTNIITGGLFGGLIENISRAVLGARSKITDTGLLIGGGLLSELLESISVGAYQEVRSRSWWFGSTRTNTQVRELGDDVAVQFQLVLDSMADAVRAGAEALGMNMDEVNAAIAAYRIEEIRISTMGLSAEEAQAELEAVFSSLFDGLAGAVVPFISQFQRVGEGLGETLVRVATGVQVTREAMRQLGFALAETDPARFAQISEGLMELMGGVDEFISGMSAFVQAFAPESEKLRIAQDALTSAFEHVGLQVPPTRDAMWALMQSLDATTESGREQIATLLRLAGVSDEYYQLLDQRADALAALDQTLADGAWSLHLNTLDSSARSVAELTRYYADLRAEFVATGATVAQLIELEEQRAEAMAQLAAELAAELHSLARALADARAEAMDWRMSMAERIADAGGPDNRLAVAADRMNALRAAIDLDGPVDDAIADLNRFAGAVDDWLSTARAHVEANLDAVRTRVETGIEALDREYDAIMTAGRERAAAAREAAQLQRDTLRAQIDALQDQLRIAQEIARVAERAEQALQQLAFSAANPAALSVRSGLLQAEIDRLREQYQRASGSDRAALGSELLSLLQQRQAMSQELFQRPTSEALAQYNQTMREIAQLRDETQVEADRALALQEQIAALQAQSVSIASAGNAQDVLLSAAERERLTAIRAEQQALRDELTAAEFVAQQELAAINAVALEHYTWVQTVGEMLQERRHNELLAQIAAVEPAIRDATASIAFGDLGSGKPGPAPGITVPLPPHWDPVPAPGPTVPTPNPTPTPPRGRDPGNGRTGPEIGITINIEATSGGVDPQQIGRIVGDEIMRQASRIKRAIANA